ncbi:MAG: NRDE family protein [Desulfuromonadales bacterium]|nr:NRDE family protein [Desulfuromonadales bacterium]
MCLILFACHQHPSYPLVMAANRDEFYARPTRTAGWWDDAPELLAGKDLSAGGTWLGVTRTGRVAAVTNYRDPAKHDPAARSRGGLTMAFLLAGSSPQAFRARLQAGRNTYNGYNLLFGSFTDLHYFSNRGSAPGKLPPGIHGLCNHLLDTPWPKVRRGKQALALALQEREPDPDKLWEVLADTTPAKDDELPDTGISRAWEKMLSSIKIVGDHYGTRTSTLLTCRKDGLVEFTERTLQKDQRTTEVRFRFTLQGQG